MNKDWVGNTKSTFSTLGASSHSEHNREDNDYYATDPNTIDKLFRVEDFSENIWEPACGGGHLSTRMKSFGKNVYSTDLIDRHYGDGTCDFLTTSDTPSPLEILLQIHHTNLHKNLLKEQWS